MEASSPPTPSARLAPAPFGIATSLALVAGVGTCLVLPALPAWPWLAAAFAFGFAGWLRADRWRLCGALSLGFGLAGLHAASTMAQQLPPALEHQESVLSGRIVGLPQSEPRRTRFRMRIDRDPSQPAALRGQVVQLSWYDDFDAVAPGPRTALSAGARWRIRAKLRAPRSLRNPGGFDGERHALAERIVATGYVREPGTARALSPPAGIDAWREATSRSIARQVPRPSSRFVRALALGDTQALDDRDWEILRANGLTHLIAISGFHVGLAAGFFALFVLGLWRALPALARRAPRSQAAGVAALLGAGVYAAMAGFALPTLRTVLMIAVVVAARLWRRPPHPAQALALAAFALLSVDPLSALAPGFWLSFVGVAWLLWCLPRSTGSMLRDFFSAQGVAALGLLPLSAVLFGQASTAGPLANLIAVPWWSLVVVPLSLLGLAAEALNSGSGGMLWRLSAQTFEWSWPVFEALSDSGLAMRWLPEPAWYALPLALFGALWLLLPRGTPAKPLALLLWLPLLWPQRGLPGHGEAELTVIDVGQGLSVLVRTSGHALLYDTGPAVRDGFDAGERAVLPALHALGVPRLDKLVISHADNDHAGGAHAVRRVMAIASASAPDGAGLPQTRPCLAGTRWRWDGVEFRFLHPPRHFPYLGNEASCVLRIETAHGAALLTGDIGEVIERRLLREDPAAVRADVVQVAHHGSRSSSDPGFVAATGARYALLSAGYGNRFRHPNPAVVERWQRAGAETLSTLEGGALRIGLTADGITAQTRRQRLPRLWDATRRHERVSYRQDRTRPDVPEG
ncbi:DNA internalization-related competence protein ComEC/Rec2 [Luteimonas sp. SX5]|uniref:DNA internalization-related competence protein ComEC/Rec2 n=1 Tax=Luteimonas galliterrae TaxID=2940486 RepID=A0ABT0MGS5_9GAMM|nr:DNA internalization-related competence protein ComEC/Rec2 [Luteimonas galliterrae]MCL1633505.1 DNA internalization-related competence protein ComEC/Rec2 [Luteimonas galliterrae]